MAPVDVSNAISQAAEWLMENQDKASGGWAERQGKPISTLNTAEAILAILESGIVDPADVRIQKGLEFLKLHQCQDGINAGAWWREFYDEQQGHLNRIPDLVRTSFAIQALLKSGYSAIVAPVKNALDWLLSVKKQESDRVGWAYRPGGAIELLPTCLALLAFLSAYRAGVEIYRDVLEEFMKSLSSTWGNASGSFGAPDYLEALNTIYAVMVLQAARQSGLSLPLKKEKAAIIWLLENQDKARMPVEVLISIVPDKEQGNYGFMFMTDTLLVRILMDSEYRTSNLAREVMISLREKRASEGGFYGYRVFSWSTARVLSALVAARFQNYQEFPERTPEYTGPRTGWSILIFAVLLSCFVVYLTVNKEFHLTQVVIFVFLMLASLLAYGKIGEKTFKEVVGKLLPNLRSD